jgi:hypothetical protein
MIKVIGNQKPHFIAPVILSKDSYRYHLPIYSLKPSSDDEVVMWTEGAVQSDGYEAGTHDGLRDGALSAKTDMSKNYVYYCLLSDWIADGRSLQL